LGRPYAHRTPESPMPLKPKMQPGRASAVAVQVDSAVGLAAASVADVSLQASRRSGATTPSAGRESRLRCRHFGQRQAWASVRVCPPNKLRAYWPVDVPRFLERVSVLAGKRLGNLLRGGCVMSGGKVVRGYGHER
jgi:hypothetical protein